MFLGAGIDGMFSTVNTLLNVEFKAVAMPLSSLISSLFANSGLMLFSTIFLFLI